MPLSPTAPALPVAFAIALAIAPAAAPAASPPLIGAGPWTVQFADRVCAMGRKFDGPGGPVTLVIKAPVIGDDYTLTLASTNRIDSPPALNKTRVIRADGVRSEEYFSTSFTAASKQRISRFTIDGEAFKLRDVGPVLTIDLGKEGSRTLAVGGLPKALDKLEECMRGLRHSFGIDQALLDRIATPIGQKTVVSLFKTEDYPASAVLARQEGEVSVLYYVETNGRVRDCQVIETSKSSALDAASCSVIRARLRTTPALDAAGTKLRAPTYLRIRWAVPQLSMLR